MQVGCTRATKIGDRKQSDSNMHVNACAAICVSVTAQKGGRSLDVLSASCTLIAAPDKHKESFFRLQMAERRKGRPPRLALDLLCLKEATLCLFSHINLVLSVFAHHKSDLGLSTFGYLNWIVVGEVAPPVPLGPS